MVSRPSGESFLRWRCAKGGSPPQKRCRGAAVASSAGASCGVRAEVLLQRRERAPTARAACSSMSFSSRLATEVMALRTIGEGEALPIVDSQRKLLYCAIPKAGCTQIRALLLRLRGAAKTSLAANPWGSSGVHRQPLPRDDGRLLLRPNDDDYFRFTLVRNPLARLLSAFLMQRGELRRRAKLPTFSSFVGALSAGDVAAFSSCDGWLQRRRQIGAARCRTAHFSTGCRKCARAASAPARRGTWRSSRTRRRCAASSRSCADAALRPPSRAGAPHATRRSRPLSSSRRSTLATRDGRRSASSSTTRPRSPRAPPSSTPPTCRASATRATSPPSPFASPPSEAASASRAVRRRSTRCSTAEGVPMVGGANRRLRGERE